jgi:hypothetical protein
MCYTAGNALLNATDSRMAFNSATGRGVAVRDCTDHEAKKRELVEILRRCLRTVETRDKHSKHMEHIVTAIIAAGWSEIVMPGKPSKLLVACNASNFARALGRAHLAAGGRARAADGRAPRRT